MLHMIIRLEAPLVSFGGEAVDNLGVTRRFPAKSMITGMIANSLGWRRIDTRAHQALQEAIVFAARIDREPASGAALTDYQSVQMEHTDKGWTTKGQPQTRAGSKATYESGSHRRFRDYYEDMSVTVALRLDDGTMLPSLEELAYALQKPARPIFIGRKTCLPSTQVFESLTEDAETCLRALLITPLRCEEEAPPMVDVLWPDGESIPEVKASRSYLLTDQRDWRSKLHGGGRVVHEGSIEKNLFKHLDSDPD